MLYGGLNLIYNIAVRIFNHTGISGEEIIGTLLLTKQSIITMNEQIPKSIQTFL